MIYWDEENFYLEHQVITLREYFVRAVIITHQKLINITASQIFKELLMVPPPHRLEAPEELTDWMKSMNVLSDKITSNEFSLALP